jgi:hypothetical protein
MIAPLCRGAWLGILFAPSLSWAMVPPPRRPPPGPVLEMMV